MSARDFELSSNLARHLLGIHVSLLGSAFTRKLLLGNDTKLLDTLGQKRTPSNQLLGSQTIEIPRKTTIFLLGWL